ncbi:hypothetical protein [Micromonospora sp. LOL_024]|uniref:hypothetical protein n=1 Tax=Micromonospora sp. LOL_024 TaxID=3345412 RepID=UPI003A858D04
MATVAGLTFAVLLTWPTLKQPWTTIPGDLGDPPLQAWQVAWSGHALVTGPLNLWHSNTFFVLLLPLLLVLVEGVNRTPHPTVPAAPPAIRAATDPILVLPTNGVSESDIMLWSTDGFPRVANGSVTFMPASQQHIRTATTAFPDPGSIAFLRQVGIRSVVVLPERLAGTPWDGLPTRPVDGLGITREEIAGAWVYRLD